MRETLTVFVKNVTHPVGLYFMFCKGGFAHHTRKKKTVDSLNEKCGFSQAHNRDNRD